MTAEEQLSSDWVPGDPDGNVRALIRFFERKADEADPGILRVGYLLVLAHLRDKAANLGDVLSEVYAAEAVLVAEGLLRNGPPADR